MAESDGEEEIEIIAPLAESSTPKFSHALTTKRKTVVLSLDTVYKADEEKIDSNSEANKELIDEKRDFVDDVFRLSSVLTPWVSAQWWNTFLIHVLPLPMLLLYPKMPELRACFIRFDGSKLPFGVKRFFYTRAYMQPLMVFIGCCIMLWATINNYFTPCDMEIQNRDVCGDGDDVLLCTPCLPGSLTCTGGLRSWNDILRGSVGVPVTVFFLYRIMIANKYAVLSHTEYQKYMQEEDPVKVASNMPVLHLTGYYTQDDYTQQRVREVRDFEITGAIIRSGVDITTNRKFVIDKPTSEHGEEALNFRRWQAFLLGKRHLADFRAQEVHPLLEKIFEPTTIEGVECYQVDVYKVIASILSWRNAVDFSPFLTSVAKYYAAVVIAIPFLSILRFEGLLAHYNLDFYPMCDMQISYEAGGNSVEKDLLALFLMTIWAYIAYEPLNAMFTILLMTSVEYSRRNVSAMLLQEMIRTNDLDASRTLSKMGITQVQRQPVADFVSIDADNGFMHTESKRNPEIARMPRFINGSKGTRGNILLWASMRCALRYYGERYEVRMEMFLRATLWAIFLGGLYLLLTFTQTRSEILHVLRYLNGTGGPLPSREVIMLMGFSLDVSSPSAVMILALAFGFFFFSFWNILFAASANKEYTNHYVILNNRMNEIQRYRSRLLVDRSYSAETRHTKLTELSNISKSFEVVYSYVTDHDKIKYCKAFGLKADGAVLTFFVTIIGSAVSVFSAITILLWNTQKAIDKQSTIIHKGC